MNSLSARLKELSADHPRGWRTKLAKECGINPVSIADWLSGKTKTINSTHIGIVARYFGVDPHWLATGKGARQHGLATQPMDIGRQVYSKDQLDVPLLANSGSMGGGAAQLEGDLVIGALTVSREWVAKHLPSVRTPEALRFIHGYGDSMSPTFNDGDVLLVDTGISSTDIDGIYVLTVRDQVFIKRVSRRFDGKHEISSDNPSVKTIEVLNGDHSVDIKGRVVWCWNGKKI